MNEPARRLSVLVVTYNERDLVERSLPPLIAQLEPEDELIVADNASTDRTAEAVERVAPRARVIRMRSNDGYMSACNEAARHASGDLLLTLDADAIVAPGFCEAIRRPLADGRGWSAWMGLLTMESGRTINTSGGVTHFTGISWAGQLGLPVQAAAGEPHEVAFLTGACLAIRREAWERDPGFPEQYFLYFDDVDLSLRLRLGGGRIGIEPDARVDHLYDFSRGRVKWRMLERNRWATVIRTFPTELLVLVLPALLATEIALLVIALRGGWVREKLRSVGDLIRWTPRLIRERRAIQARRSISAAEFADHLTAELSNPYLGRAGRSRALGTLLATYWFGVRRLLEHTRG
ncbi:MAG: glycosyltransferase family 2 protein [Thermoleophilaceae bacterium]